MAVAGNQLYVTYADAHSDFLKIWGQPNRMCALYIEKQLSEMTPELDQSPTPPPNKIRKGVSCLAKFSGDTYCRAKIASDVIQNNRIKVSYIDFGNVESVDLSRVRLLSGPPDGLITTIVPQAEEFILANVQAEFGFTSDVLEEIRLGLCYNEYTYQTVNQNTPDKLIQLNYKGEDYSSYLVRHNYAKPIAVKEQVKMLNNLQRTQKDGTLANALSSNPITPQPSKRGNSLKPKEAVLRQITQEFFNQSVQKPQPRLSPSGLTQACNSSEPNEENTPALTNVVIEALANQLRHHILQDQSASASALGSSNQYFSEVLAVGRALKAFISAIEDGPWAFSVQLLSDEYQYSQLMEELNKSTFAPMKLPIMLGSPCVAKSQKLESYCRGVVINVARSAVKVYLVDIGNTEELPYNLLFDVPTKFFQVKTFSHKFSLCGLEHVEPTYEIKRAFTELVERQLVTLYVTHLEGESLPRCDLFFNDLNVKKILNDRFRQSKYWNPSPLPRLGEIENVTVTCVESAKKFYVQLKRRNSDLKDIKTELAKLGTDGDHFDQKEIVPGTICVAFYGRENAWYRASVKELTPDENMVTVMYVDYGNSEKVDYRLLKKVGTNRIVLIKTLAIPCILQGFEDEPADSPKTALEQVILNKEFSMKVVSQGNNYITVQLFDEGRDVSLGLRNSNIYLEETQPTSEIKETTENHAVAESDSACSVNSQTLRMDSVKSRSKKGQKNENPRPDLANWRSALGLDNTSSKSRDDTRESSWGMRSDKRDSNKSGRHPFKGKKGDNSKHKDRDQKNWRGTANYAARNNVEIKNTPKLGESITERMKRAARENEERGNKLVEDFFNRLPVKLENIVFRGHEFKKKEVEMGSTEEVIITCFVNANEIYVQLSSSKQSFESFTSEMHEYYNTKLPLINKPKLGDVVVAKSRDGDLYRALVTKVEPITIRFVDFGKEEVTEKENLWPMDKRFVQLESQCLKCTLPNITLVDGDTWTPHNRPMAYMFECKPYLCTFLNKTDDIYEVQLIGSDDDKNIRSELISNGFAYQVGIMENAIPMAANAIGNTLPLGLLVNDALNVRISYAKAPSEFYVQIRSSIIKFIEKQLRRYAMNKKVGLPADAHKINNGEFCVVELWNDWYRGQVIEKRNNDANVKLIDYAGAMIVNYKQIRPIPDDLRKYPPQAIPCSLHIEPNEISGQLSKDLASYEGKDFFALFRHLEDEKLTVTLYNCDGEKLKMCRSDMRSPDWIRPIAELPILSHQMQVIVSHVKSPKEIYVRLLYEAEDFRGFTSSLRNFYSDKQYYEDDLHEFEMYAVKSVSDNSWYRAELLSYNDISAEMFFIDSGISEQVPRENIKKLEPQFFANYAFAKRVSLNIDYDEDYGDCINANLRKLIEKKVFMGYFVKMNGITYAEFELDGILVTPQILSGSVQERQIGMFDGYILKEESEGPCQVYIAYVSHPNEFWVHEKRLYDELASLQTEIQNICWNGIEKDNLMVGDVVGTIFTDNCWYRSLITAVKGNIITVYFLDYGNTCDLEKGKNKFILLSKKLERAPPLVRKCSLKGFWKKNAASRFEDIVMKNDYTYDLIELDDDGKTIDLMINGLSVTEQLIAEGFAKEDETDEGHENNEIDENDGIHNTEENYEIHENYGIQEIYESYETYENYENESVLSDVIAKIDSLPNGSNINEQLIAEERAEGEDGERVFISHINSPADFYVQKDKNQDLFGITITEMAKAESLDNAKYIKENEIYCAKYPDDSMWYRAKVLAQDQHGVVVSFIDYGSYSTVHEIKELPIDLKSMPPLAENCSLYKNSRASWSEAARNSFFTFTGIPLKMKVIRKGPEMNTVSLFTEKGENVSEILAGASQINLGDNNVQVREETKASSQNMASALFTDFSDTCPVAGGQTSPTSNGNTFKAMYDLTPKPEPVRTPNRAQSDTEKNVAALFGLGEGFLKTNENLEYARALSSSEKKVHGPARRGLSPEGASALNIQRGGNTQPRASASPRSPFSLVQQQQQQQQKPRVPPPQQQKPRVPPPQQQKPRVPSPQQQKPRVPPPHQKQPRVPPPQQKQPRVPPPQQQKPRVPPPQQKQPRVPPPQQKQPRVPPPQQQQPRVPPPQQQMYQHMGRENEPLSGSISRRDLLDATPDRVSHHGRRLAPATNGSTKDSGK